MFEVKTALYADSSPAYTFACFVLICWLVCIAVMLYSIIRNKEHRLIGCTPMFGMVIFLLFNTYVGTITYPWGDGVGYVDYSSFSLLMSASYGLQMAAAGIWFVATVPKDELTITFPKSSHIKKSSHMISEADELRKYKELLDMGAITQEEFDAKKKELLNL